LQIVFVFCIFSLWTFVLKKVAIFYVELRLLLTGASRRVFTLFCSSKPNYGKFVLVFALNFHQHILPNFAIDQAHKSFALEYFNLSF